MKPAPHSLIRASLAFALLLSLLLVPRSPALGSPATVLFEDDFNSGIPGWFAVHPLGGVYVEDQMIWEYDAASKSFSEQSNVYTDGSAYSSSRIAVMLINETVAPAAFSYTARLTAGDDDGFGLIFGYQNETTFYRVQFARQNDANRNAHWPFTGWNLDRMSDGQITDLGGASTIATNASYVPYAVMAGVPFDVTITVADNKLTLTVVDDPAGAATLYSLVTDKELPSSAAGQVGMFSWGMSGGNPRAFRVQNPVLAPTPLTGDPASQVLSNWSFLVTPRSDGSTAINSGGPDPIWAQGYDVGGNRGTMIENSDSYNSGDNNANGTTNFIAHSAVAGDVNWSNYVYTVRFIANDDDGFGMLLRYQDEMNFYRIAFRAQSSASGPKRGISIQKNVNLNFDQVFYNNAFSDPANNYIPPWGTRTPIDVHAAIQNDRLQLIVVNDPDSLNAQSFFFGPFDITGEKVDKGKIGIFSWAMYGANAPIDSGTEVDFVKVRQVEGEGLFVSSLYGTPDPAVGLNDFPSGTVITGKVAGAVTTAPGVRQVSVGWAGVGSVPATGTSNEVSFTLNGISSITWKWQTQYLLTVNATAGGTAVATLGPWINPGSNVTATATANSGYVFTGWSGDNLSSLQELAFDMVRPITLTANFAADSDNDKLPDDWETQYWGDLAQTSTDDPDHDGKDNLLEYQLGTNPKSLEELVFSDDLTSRWINESRDRALPGWFVVTNFGSGFRGLWESSNQNRAANSAGPHDAPFITTTNYGTNASFQGPLLLVRTNVWDPAWANTFSLSADYSLGDDDGACLYFRYLNESNWFRVTLCAQANTTDPTRPLDGVTIQKRTNGWFSAVALTGDSGSVALDPLDGAGPVPGFKRVRVTVNGANDTFEVRVIGWDVIGLNPPDWNPSFERVLTFTDDSLPTGRIGVGDWGMDGFGAWNSTTNNPSQPDVQMNPVGAGAYVDNIILRVDGTNAFVEDWETATLHTDFPAGWENPYAGGPSGGLVGDWHVSAHGTIADFTAAYGTLQTGTTEFPKGDVEGPILLAPALTNRNYVLELGIQPMDDGGMGFVYDFQDTDNFARVLFNAQSPAPGGLAQGLSVSRKSNGAWTDLVVGDRAFVYTPGRRFDVHFANNNGACSLSAWNTDDPAAVSQWHWTEPPATAANRVGLAIWDMPDAHFTYLRAYDLPVQVPSVPFKITSVALSGGSVILDVTKPGGAMYHVLRAATVDGLYSTVAVNQASAQYTETAPAGTAFYRLQLVP